MVPDSAQNPYSDEPAGYIADAEYKDGHPLEGTQQPTDADEQHQQPPELL